MDYYIVDRMGGGSREDENPSVARMVEHLDSLDPNDDEHPCVSLVHRESGWGIEVFASGLLILENTSIRDSERHLRAAGRDKVLALWQALALGDIQTVMAEPWAPGYGN